MDQFFHWVSTTPVARVTLTALAAIVVLAVVTTYLVAFFQGREISVWPPKIGAKPIQPETKGKRMITVEDPEKEPHRVESVKAIIGAANRLTRETGEVENPQRDARTSLASVRLSNKPIAVLEAVDGPINRSIYILVTRHRDITVGRDLSCDLPIESDLLSRQHFRLRISLNERAEQAERGFHFELIDPESHNGTFLNGAQVREPAIIKNGVSLKRAIAVSDSSS